MPVRTGFGQRFLQRQSAFQVHMQVDQPGNCPCPGAIFPDHNPLAAAPRRVRQEVCRLVPGHGGSGSALCRECPDTGAQRCRCASLRPGRSGMSGAGVGSRIDQQAIIRPGPDPFALDADLQGKPFPVCRHRLEDISHGTQAARQLVSHVLPCPGPAIEDLDFESLPGKPRSSKSV